MSRRARTTLASGLVLLAVAIALVVGVYGPTLPSWVGHMTGHVVLALIVAAGMTLLDGLRRSDRMGFVAVTLGLVFVLTQLIEAATAAIDRDREGLAHSTAALASGIAELLALVSLLAWAATAIRTRLRMRWRG